MQTFAVNNLNQLTNIGRSGTLTVAGNTTGPATNVTVNGSSASRYSDHSFARDGLSIVSSYTALAQDTNGRSSSHTISVDLPASVTNIYDANGNLTYDGQKAFEYDDENQLVRVTRTNNWKSEFTYDGKLRRRVRKEYTWSSGSSSWVLSNEVRYVYDGNLVIQERNSWNLPQVTYTRGNDLSGSMEGAGGIGGLLARTDHSTLLPSHAYYFADRNGNVTMLISTQQLSVAKYQYDPFGNLLSSSGPLAEANLYRFSSKELHPVSGLIYYLYRYYAPELQRWVNRDPLGEIGGFNLYLFVINQPLNYFDAFGLDEGGIKPPGGIDSDYDGPLPVTTDEGDKSKCAIVPNKGKSPPGDWDFVKLPDGTWWKIGPGELDINKHGKPKWGQIGHRKAKKDEAERAEKLLRDKGQKK